MPVTGATPDTITFFPTAITADSLQAAIRKATPKQRISEPVSDFWFAVPATYATNFF